ncbi:MAG: PrsW family intramembrane metalloprotease [Bacteroidales bacterium]|nr:PrsW family intramembrane metalloprotease [Bacteroidales bacterium]
MQTANLIILGLALIPAAVLMIIMLIRDKQQPEPFPWLLRGVIYGVLSAFGSMLISVPLLASGLVPTEFHNSIEAVWHSFGAAAIPEETAKLFFLWLLLRRNPYFDEHLDGIVYSVCIGLGFAALENIEYLFAAGDAWLATGIVRALLAVPAHFFFAVLMGYYYSLVHFGHHPRRNAFKVWAVPVLAHGIYDAIAMSQSVAVGLEALFGIALLFFCNELRKLGQRHIRELAEVDNSHYNKKES